MEWVNMVDYTQDKAFWERLKSFVENINTGCAMDEDEKNMILNECEIKLRDFTEVGAVIGGFMADTIYIVPPYNNHVRFFKVHPNIPNSRAIIEFLKGNDKDPDGDFIVSFQADCEIDGDQLKCIRSDFGQKWETVIDVDMIKVDGEL